MKQRINIPTGNNRPNVIERIGRYLLALPADKAFTVLVEPYKRTRSDPQNNALWGVAYATLQDATGHDKDDLHEYFCGEFFGWHPRTVMGKKKLSPKRTTTRNAEGKRDVISTAMFMDFYAFIQQRAAETVGVYVPDPNEELEC